MSSFAETKTSPTVDPNVSYFKGEFTCPDITIVETFDESVKQMNEGIERNGYIHYKGDPISRPVSASMSAVKAGSGTSVPSARRILVRKD
jgi:hypothetical protein